MNDKEFMAACDKALVNHNIVWVARVMVRVNTGSPQGAWTEYKTVCVEAQDRDEAYWRAAEFGDVVSVEQDRRKLPRTT